MNTVCKNSTQNAPKRAIFHSEVKTISGEGTQPLPRRLPIGRETPFPHSTFSAFLAPRSSRLWRSTVTPTARHFRFSDPRLIRSG